MKVTGSGFEPGDRVQVIREVRYHGKILAGEVGTVVRASNVSHATANGGGFDVTVRLDERDPAREARRAAALRELLTPPADAYIAEHAAEVLIRSTDLRRADG